jgi:hypothetical protein
MQTTELVWILEILGETNLRTSWSVVLKNQVRL